MSAIKARIPTKEVPMFPMQVHISHLEAAFFSNLRYKINDVCMYVCMFPAMLKVTIAEHFESN